MNCAYKYIIIPSQSLTFMASDMDFALLGYSANYYFMLRLFFLFTAHFVSITPRQDFDIRLCTTTISTKTTFNWCQETHFGIKIKFLSSTLCFMPSGLSC